VTRIDSETKHESRLLFPGLQSFYDVAVPPAWPIVRIAVGWNLVVHGWGKVTRGPSVYVRAFVEQGFDPALPWIWAALMIEFVGGIALIVGLFTRFFAAADAVEMLVITFLYWKAGFSWPNGGYEYTLLGGLVCFAIALRGGGPYSLDRRIGVELWTIHGDDGLRRSALTSSLAFRDETDMPCFHITAPCAVSPSDTTQNRTTPGRV